MNLVLDKLAGALTPDQPEALLIGGQALAAYGRDLADILSLLQQNPQALERNSLRQICEQFGPPGIRDELERLRP